MKPDKRKKLADIARLYYEQDKTQNEIARIYGVSRPLVSRMLREAREAGIVRIEICDPAEEGTSALWSRAGQRYGIRGGVIVPAAEHDSDTNRSLARETVRYLSALPGKRFGIGWGTIIGELVSQLDTENFQGWQLESVCPLVGNSGVSNRNYHTSENVRILSQRCGADPCYLYTPAFAETREELELVRRMEHYKAVEQRWRRMDVALVNIGNYPSVPDFACATRFGNMLTKGRAAGRLLAYYFDGNGGIFHSDTDYAIQAPVEMLARCRDVVGICSANVNPRALAGALRTGLIHHIAATEELLSAALELPAET